MQGRGTRGPSGSWSALPPTGPTGPPWAQVKASKPRAGRCQLALPQALGQEEEGNSEVPILSSSACQQESPGMDLGQPCCWTKRALACIIFYPRTKHLCRGQEWTWTVRIWKPVFQNDRHSRSRQLCNSGRTESWSQVSRLSTLAQPCANSMT